MEQLRKAPPVILEFHGTFDPPHLNHMNAMLQALVGVSDTAEPRTYYAVFSPIGDGFIGDGDAGARWKPNKLPFEHRYQMTRLISETYSPLLSAIDANRDRSDDKGAIGILTSVLASDLKPLTDFYTLIGADNVKHLATYIEKDLSAAPPGGIRMHFAILNDFSLPDVVARLSSNYPDNITVVNDYTKGLRSTGIRKKQRFGVLPFSMQEYIQKNALYGTGAQTIQAANAATKSEGVRSEVLTGRRSEGDVSDKSRSEVRQTGADEEASPSAMVSRVIDEFVRIMEDAYGAGETDQYAADYLDQPFIRKLELGQGPIDFLMSPDYLKDAIESETGEYADKWFNKHDDELFAALEAWAEKRLQLRSIQVAADALALQVKAGVQAVPALIEVMERSQDHGTLIVTALALGALKDQRAVPALLAAMKHAHQSFWSHVVLALGEIGDPRALPALVKALREEMAYHYPNEQKEVIIAISKIGGPEAVALLTDALKDQNEDIRNRASDALEMMKNRGTTGRSEVRKGLAQGVNKAIIDHQGFRIDVQDRLGNKRQYAKHIEPGEVYQYAPFWVRSVRELKEEGIGSLLPAHALKMPMRSPRELEKLRKELERQAEDLWGKDSLDDDNDYVFFATNAASSIERPFAPKLVCGVKTMEFRRGGSPEDDAVEISLFNGKKLRLQGYRLDDGFGLFYREMNDAGSMPAVRSELRGSLKLKLVLLTIAGIMASTVRISDVQVPALLKPETVQVSSADTVKPVPRKTGAFRQDTTLNQAVYKNALMAKNPEKVIEFLHRLPRGTRAELGDASFFIEHQTSWAEVAYKFGAEAAGSLGQEAPLTEEGYRSVAETRNPFELLSFLHRLPLGSAAKLGDASYFLENRFSWIRIIQKYGTPAAGNAGRSEVRSAADKEFRNALSDLQIKWWDGWFELHGLGRRVAAVRTLVRLNDPRAVPVLAAALRKDPASRVGVAIVKFLWKVEDAGVVPVLIDALNDVNLDPTVRWVAADSLEKLKDLRAVPALIGALKDKNMVIRQSAAYALAELKGPRVGPALIEALQDKSSYVRRAAAYALGTLKYAGAVDPLIGMLQDEDWYARRDAATALEKMGDPRAASALDAFKLRIQKERLEKESLEPAADSTTGHGDSPRGQTLEGLSAIAALPFARGFWDDGGYAIADLKEVLIFGAAMVILGVAAYLYLKKLNRDEAVARLEDIRSSDIDVVRSRQIGAAIEDIQSASEEVRTRASAALIDLKATEALDILTVMLEDADLYAATRQAIAIVLGKIGDAQALLSLRNVLGDKDVGAYAKAALEEFNRNSRSEARLPTDASAAGLASAVETHLRRALKDLQPKWWDGLSIDGGVNRRIEAIKILGGINHPSVVVPALSAVALNDLDRYVRMEAAIEICRIKDPSVVPALIKVLVDTNGPLGVRWAAAMELRKRNDPRSVPAFLVILNDKSVMLRTVAAEALTDQTAPEIVPALIEKLEDPNRLVRDAAAAALEKTGDLRAVSELKGYQKQSAAGASGGTDTSARSEVRLTPMQEKEFRKAVTNLKFPWYGFSFNAERDIRERAAAAKTLAGLRDRRAVPVLVAALKDKEAEVREAVIEALLELDALPELGRELSNFFVDVRMAAVKALRFQKSIPGLVEALNDDALTVRASAMSGLRVLNAWSELSEQLRNPYHEVRIEAVTVLAERKSPDAIPSLIEALLHWDVYVRDIAITALRELKAWSELADEIDSKYADVRRAAIDALREMGALAELGGELNSMYPDVRRAAAAALADRNDTGKVPELLKALNDRLISDAVAEALEKIGDPRAASALREYGQLKAREEAERQARDGQMNVVAWRSEVRLTSEQETQFQSALKELKMSWMEKFFGFGGDYRLAAAKTLGELKDPRALPALTDALKNDKDPEVRQAAADALGAIKSPAAVAALISALQNDKDPEVRVAVARALGKIKDPGAVPALVKAMKTDKSGIVRFETTAALGDIKDASAVLDLLEVLNGNDVHLRYFAREALAAIGAPSVLGLLAVLKGTDASASRAATYALIRIQGPDAALAFTEALKDESEAVRTVAASMLERIKNESVRYGKSRSELRGRPTLRDARRADWQSGSLRSWIEILENNADPEARITAAAALGYFRDPRVVNVLMDAYAKDEGVAFRSTVVDSLFRIRSPLAVFYLVKILKTDNEDPKVLIDAAEALGTIQDEIAVTALIYVLKKSKDPAFRYAVVKALGAIKDPGAVPALVVALSDPSVAVCRAAARALVAIQDPDSVPLLIEVLKSDSDFVKVVAAVLLVLIRRATVLNHGSRTKYSRQEIMDELKDMDAAALVSWDSRDEAAFYAGMDRALRRTRLKGIVDERTARSEARAGLHSWTEQNFIEVLENEKDYGARAVKARIFGSSRDRRTVPALVKALEDDKEDPRVRAAAAKALGRIQDVRAIPVLVRALERDGDARVRIEGARALSSFNDLSAVPALIRALDDESAVVGRAAFRTLGTVKDPGLVPMLTDAMKGDSQNVKKYVALLLKNINAALARTGNAPVMFRGSLRNWIDSLKNDQDPKVRIAAVMSLGAFDDPRAVVALKEAIKSDPDELVRSVARKAFGKAKGSRVVPVLMEVLADDKDPDLRAAAARALGEINDPRAVPALVKALENDQEDREVRIAAAEALGKTQDPQAVSALLRALNDKDRSIRRFASLALRSVRDITLAPVFAGALNNDSDFVKAVAASVLVQIHRAAAINGNARSEARDTRGLPVRDVIIAAGAVAAIFSLTAWGLWALGFFLVRSLLLSLMISPLLIYAARRFFVPVTLLVWGLRQMDRPLMRIIAADELGDQKGPLAIAALLEALEHDPHPGVRIMAAMAFEKNKAREAVPALIAALKDSDERLVTASLSALGTIGDPSAIPALRDASWSSIDFVKGGALWALDQIERSGRSEVREASEDDVETLIREKNIARKRTLLAGILVWGGLNALVLAFFYPQLRASEIFFTSFYIEYPLLVLIGALLISKLVRSNHSDNWRVSDPVSWAVNELRSPNVFVREAAIYTLVRQHDSRAVPALLKELKDEIPQEQILDIRGLVAKILGEIGDSSAVPGLIEALKDHNRLVRYHAAVALGKFGDPSAVDALTALYKATAGGDRRISRAAKESLEKIRSVSRSETRKQKVTIPLSVDAIAAGESEREVLGVVFRFNGSLTSDVQTREIASLAAYFRGPKVTKRGPFWLDKGKAVQVPGTNMWVKVIEGRRGVSVTFEVETRDKVFRSEARKLPEDAQGATTAISTSVTEEALIEKIKALRARSIQEVFGLPEKNVRAMTETQIWTATAMLLRMVPENSLEPVTNAPLKALTGVKIPTLTGNQILALRKDQIRALTDVQRGWLNARVEALLAPKSVSRSETRSALPADVKAAAVALFDHLAASSQNIPKDPVVVILGNPLKEYPSYVKEALEQLRPSKVLIVGNGVKKEDRSESNPPEWKRISEAMTSRQGKVLFDPNDESMNTGQNIETVIAILSREGIAPENVVLVQVPQGLLVSKRIFEKQWTEKVDAMLKARKINGPVPQPKFFTYASSAYRVQVKRFLETGDPDLVSRIMYFGPGQEDVSSALLKDIVGQVYRLRTFNEWGEGFIKFYEEDLSDAVLANEAVLSRHFGTTPISFETGDVALREYGFGDHEFAFAVVDRGFERSKQGDIFRSSRPGFDRVNNLIQLDGSTINPTKDKRVDDLKAEPQEFPGLIKPPLAAGRTVVSILPNGNLGMNDWFVGIADGKVYHYRGDTLDENRRYGMLVVTVAGETKVMTLHFKQNGAAGIFDEKGTEVASTIRYGIYGQHVQKNGKPNFDEAAVQFDDMRHLLRFPIFKRKVEVAISGEKVKLTHQIHPGFSDYSGELYNDPDKLQTRAALRGEAVSLDLAPLSKLSPPVTEKERDVVFGNWGYKNVTGQKSSAKNLAAGEYLIDGSTLWIRFQLGTHPHSFFGIIQNPETQEKKIIAGVVRGQTLYRGATLEKLPEMIQKEINPKYVLQDLFLGGNGKDTYMLEPMSESENVTAVEQAYGKGFSAVMVVEKPVTVAPVTPQRSELREEGLKETPVIPQVSVIDTSSLGAKLRVAGEVVAKILPTILSSSKAYASEIAVKLFAGSAHYQIATETIPATFAANWPVFNATLAQSATASTERMVIDQRQGVPDAASVLPLVTFARYNPKAEVVLALIAETADVDAFIKKLAAPSPKGTVPQNFKVRAFANENEFVAAFAGLYNSAAPLGKSVALITDREVSAVTQKIGSRRHLLSVVGAQEPLKQTASTLLAADKLLNESIWSMGYHFVSVEKLGGLEALMAELTSFVAAQAKVLASA